MFKGCSQREKEGESQTTADKSTLSTFVIGDIILTLTVQGPLCEECDNLNFKVTFVLLLYSMCVPNGTPTIVYLVLLACLGRHICFLFIVSLIGLDFFVYCLLFH